MIIIVIYADMYLQIVFIIIIIINIQCKKNKKIK
jgi:hypothetical protein